jgi:DNA-binding beta-propeller fold protein YncE
MRPMSPRGVAVTPDGEIIVADTGNDRLEFFTPTGAFDLTYGSTGGGNSQFFGPNGLLLMGSTLYVADTYNSRIQVVALP